MSSYIPLSHGLRLFRAEAEIGFRVCTASASDPKHESEHNREGERRSWRRCRKEWKALGVEAEGEKFVHMKRMGVWRRMGVRGGGREVTGLGHVSHTLESPEGRGAWAW